MAAWIYINFTTGWPFMPTMLPRATVLYKYMTSLRIEAHNLSSNTHVHITKYRILYYDVVLYIAREVFHCRITYHLKIVYMYSCQKGDYRVK